MNYNAMAMDHLGFKRTVSSLFCHGNFQLGVLCQAVGKKKKFACKKRVLSFFTNQNLLHFDDKTGYKNNKNNKNINK